MRRCSTQVNGRLYDNPSLLVRSLLFCIAATMSEEKSSAFVLFGIDFLQVPCFRKSFLYGLGTGIGGGLVTFLATSRPHISMHIGMGTYVVSTFLIFTACRYNYSKIQNDTWEYQRAFSEGTKIITKEEGKEVEIDTSRLHEDNA